MTILYPGASPQEAEDLVVIPIEEELDKIDQVSELLTTAGEGYAFFMLKFDDMSDAEFTTKMQEVRQQIDNAVIPEETEDPIVEDFGSDDFVPVISVAATTTGDLEMTARLDGRPAGGHRTPWRRGQGPALGPGGAGDLGRGSIPSSSTATDFRWARWRRPWPSAT